MTVALLLRGRVDGRELFCPESMLDRKLGSEFSGTHARSAAHSGIGSKAFRALREQGLILPTWTASAMMGCLPTAMANHICFHLWRKRSRDTQSGSRPAVGCCHGAITRIPRIGKRDPAHLGIQCSNFGVELNDPKSERSPLPARTEHGIGKVRTAVAAHGRRSNRKRATKTCSTLAAITKTLT